VATKGTPSGGGGDIETCSLTVSHGDSSVDTTGIVSFVAGNKYENG
jgi:hypothetical protein